MSIILTQIKCDHPECYRTLVLNRREKCSDYKWENRTLAGANCFHVCPYHNHMTAKEIDDLIYKALDKILAKANKGIV